jgi:DNA-binding helix-hairpin-helix protein with protein kinase domain
LDSEQVTKLQAMVSCWSTPLEAIAAWPRSILYDASSRKPCGVLMARLIDARPLHELYGTTNRRRHFPDVGWHHMVLAARNTAAAFQTLHAANIVVGDVNQGNLLVDKRMCVRMIDCDSFQLNSNGRTFACPVGTPHFTPPELQSQKLRDIIRNQNHDRFGLAVLIFHLLFIGRHPFAGRFRGTGDLSIEKAIAEYRFAFSKKRQETLVDPPPASLLIDDFPTNVASLFEAAFRSPAEANARPTPIQWVQELEGLMKFRKACRFDSVHVYSAHLTDCPWCRIEDAGGPSFFVPAGGATTITADRLAALENQIMELPEFRFIELPAQRLTVPKLPPLRTMKTLTKRAWPEWYALLLITAWVSCLLGAFIGGTAGLVTLGAAAAFSVGIAVALVLNKQARERRKSADDYLAWLQKAQQNLAQQAQGILAHHRRREEGFDQSTADLKNEIAILRNAEAGLKDTILTQRENQKADYLRGYAIRDSIRQIPHLTYSQVAMLEAFGVESANDIEQIRLYGIPTIDPETVIELLQWRRNVEPGFKFNPEHGITLANMGSAKEAAIRKFKISQARKILTAAKQITMLGDVAKDELARACTQFDDASERWKNTAKQFRDFQSQRRSSERLLNRTPAALLCSAVGIPVLALLIWLIIG